MFSTEKGFIKYLEDRMNPFTLNEKGKSTAKKYYNEYPASILKEAADISFSQYLRYDEAGNPTEESVRNCINKLGGIAYNKTRNPLDAAVSHLLSIGRKGFEYWSEFAARELISGYVTALKKVGLTDQNIIDDLEQEAIPLIKSSKNWSSWKAKMEGWTKDVIGWQDEEEITQNNSILPQTIYIGTRGYIEKIAVQINASYENNLYDCCAVMLRRLMEVLLVQAFQNNSLEDRIAASDTGQHISLDAMIKVASSCSELSLSSNTKQDMQKIKELGNYSAHKIWYNCTKHDIEPIILKYRAIVEELMYKAGLKN